MEGNHTISLDLLSAARTVDFAALVMEWIRMWCFKGASSEGGPALNKVVERSWIVGSNALISQAGCDHRCSLALSERGMVQIMSCGGLRSGSNAGRVRLASWGTIFV